MRVFSKSSLMSPALTSILILILSMNSDPTFAQTDYEFTVVSGDQLKNNPFAQKILDGIKIMKQQIIEKQQRQKQLQEHQKFIEEQRKIAKQKLDEQLSRMNKDNEPTNH